jgi:hypothetical protein
MMTLTKLTEALGILLFVLFCTSTVQAQHLGNPYALLLKSGVVEPEANTESLTGFVDNSDGSNPHVYLQFQAVPNAATREKMKQLGVQLFEYLPHKTYIAALPVGFDLAQLKTIGVRSLIEIKPEYKMSVQLVERPLPEYAVSGNKVKVNFQYYRDVNADKMQEALNAQGITILNRFDFGHKFTIEIAIDDIETFTAMPFVAYIEAIDPPATPENYTARTNHRNNVIAADYPMGRHYDGSGVHVAMGDDGIIGPHIDYQGRNDMSRVNSNNGDHGDHVAGIIMGAGNLDPKGRGQAFGADLHVYDVWDAVNDSPADFVSDSIRLTSTSYGNGCNAGYTSFAQDADQMIRQFPQLMHVFSAGNSGGDDCGYGAGSGWANVTGGIKIGKNVTAVANLGATDVLANSSSRGPASDGRTKPDMAAVGSSVYSTVDENDYAVKSGTSMSCPGVTGTYAQLIHAFRELNGIDPESGLLKALLMNGAEDLGNAGPDFKYGYGRINSARAVRTMEDGRYQAFTLDQGDSIVTTINIPAGTQQARFMVYWTDWEGSTQSTLALVNDLDLVVTDPSSISFEPWILDPTPNPTTLNLPATRGVDHLNNAEQVTVDDPVSGTYTITIKGFQVPQGPQKCWLVWEHIDASIALTYPIGGEGLVPGENEFIRWDAYGATGTIDLEYSADSGATWNSIVAGLSGTSRYYSWSVPGATSGNSLVRVTRGAFSDESNAVFSVIRLPLNLEIDWVCPDSLQLSWSAVQDATEYEISQLGVKYMDAIGTTTATSFVVMGTNPNVEDWFSVKALGPDNARGRRAYAVDKPAGVFDCELPDDAAVEEILSPGQGTLQGCNNINAIEVTILLVNEGINALTNIPVWYEVSGLGTQQDVYTGTLLPDSVDEFTFSVPVSLSGNTSYVVTAWVEYPGDPNETNDTREINLQTTSSGTTVTLPWSDNFENNNPCGTQNDCGQTQCNLNNDWYQGSNGFTDDIDWREDKDGTPSDGTGPSVDHNPGTDQGIYLFTEASGDCLDQAAFLTTPCIDLTNTSSPRLEFWYHMLGTAMGELHVDVLVGSYWELDVALEEGNHGNPWRQGLVDLSDFEDEIINIRWRGITGDDFDSDMAIDDVSVYETVSVNESALGAGISVFPNPSNGSFTVNWAENKVSTVKVYSALGALVLEMPVTSERNSINLMLEDVETGIYFLELQIDGQRVNKKLVIN